MGNEDGIVIEEKPNIIIYGVDMEDGQWFQSKLHEYKGNSGRRLLKDMRMRYDWVGLLTEIKERLDKIEERIESLEDNSIKKVKTFRGEK